MSVSTNLWFHVVPAALDGSKLSKLVAAYPFLIEALSKHQNQKSAKYKEDLRSLDEYRYKELPELLAVRHKSSHENDGSNGLELDELKRLLEWKMSRGVFRPTLRGLIAGNSLESVRTITAQAFTEYASSTSSSSKTPIDKIQQAVKTLCKLRGVGPATASLILSAAYPKDVPFFSDELFTWISVRDESMLVKFLNQKYPKGTGDDIEGVRTDKITGIKYTEAEYKKLCTVVLELRQQLLSESEDVSATDIEKASFVALQGLEALGFGSALHDQGDVGLQGKGAIDNEKQSRNKSRSRDSSPSPRNKQKNNNKPADNVTNGKRRSSRLRKEDEHVTTQDSKRRKVLLR